MRQPACHGTVGTCRCRVDAVTAEVCLRTQEANPVGVLLSSPLSNDLAIWRKLWDDGGDLARHAHAYIEGMIQASRAR